MFWDSWLESDSHMMIIALYFLQFVDKSLLRNNNILINEEKKHPIVCQTLVYSWRIIGGEMLALEVGGDVIQK